MFCMHFPKGRVNVGDVYAQNRWGTWSAVMPKKAPTINGHSFLLLYCCSS